MISLMDIIIISAGYVIGLAVGFLRGLKLGRDRFWKAPSSSWNARK